MTDKIHEQSSQGLPNYQLKETTSAGLSQYASTDHKLDTELGKDDALLASLGYKAELKREFTALEVYGLAFSIIGLLPSIASTLVYSMPAGGPVGMVYQLLSQVLIVGLGMAYCRMPDSSCWSCDG